MIILTSFLYLYVKTINIIYKEIWNNKKYVPSFGRYYLNNID